MANEPLPGSCVHHLKLVYAFATSSFAGLGMQAPLLIVSGDALFEPILMTSLFDANVLILCLLLCRFCLAPGQALLYSIAILMHCKKPWQLQSTYH